MPSIFARPSHMPHHSASQADLDVLSLLTGDDATMGPLSLSRDAAAAGGSKKRQVPRRDGPLDALMISAVLAGSGPMSRHHFGHGAGVTSALGGVGSYASCDDSRPVSPSKERERERPVVRSMQAPRSERLRRLSEGVQSGVGPDARDASLAPLAGPSSSSRASPTSPKAARSSFSKVRRRMSIDPAPVSAALQAASPPSFARALPNPLLQPRLGTGAGAGTGRPQVRCMARTRVPTPHGDVFLHLYHNSVDNKEHLAIVLDPAQLSAEARAAAPRGRREIRSRSLEERWREGETEMERVVRGAYVGRLGPGGEDQASDPARAPASVSASAPASHAEDIDIEGIQEVQDVLPLVRIHSECFTGETIGSMRCDCGEQLDEAIRRIASPQPLGAGSGAGVARRDLPPTPESSRSPSPSEVRTVPGRGVVIYMRQEGRGIGLLEKIRAYNLQDLGHDTVTANLMLGHGADERKYDVAAEILRDLGLGGGGGGGVGGSASAAGGIRLLTNNPDKVQGLAREGIVVKERVGMVPRDWTCAGQDEPRAEEEYEAWRDRRAGVGLIGAGRASGVELERYLRTKVERMGHLLSLPGQDQDGMSG